MQLFLCLYGSVFLDILYMIALLVFERLAFLIELIIMLYII